MTGFPYIFTFYSYKGGVGRSMALLNVAYSLAARGRHVLIIDMDLEAPGVSGFLQRNQELEEPQSDQKDVLDLLWTVLNAPPVSEDPSLYPEEMATIDKFVRPAMASKLHLLKPPTGKVGHVDVVTAEQERDYWSRLARLNLASLDSDKLCELSAKLWRYLKAQRIPFVPIGLEPNEAMLVPYDYILVDSRTGITETGGLCVGPLADRLVVITGLNDQNIQGTLEFLREAGIEPKSRDSNAPAWDDADDVSDEARRALTLGPKPTLIVASPLPAGEVAFKAKRLEEIGKLIGPVAAKLSYHPQMALIESLFVRDHKDEYLAMEYAGLTDKIMAHVDDHYSQLAQNFRKLLDEDDKFQAADAAIRVTQQEPEIGISLLTKYLDKYHFHPKNLIDEDYLVFRKMYALAFMFNPKRHELLYNWGNALSAQANTKTGTDADRLFAQSYEKYSEAIALKPHFHEAFNNWGLALSDQAKTKTGTEADRLFEQSYEKYSKALELKPDDSPTLYNLACRAALKGDLQECLDFLKKAADTGWVGLRKRVEEDEDFSALLSHPRMQEFLDSLS